MLILVMVILPTAPAMSAATISAPSSSVQVVAVKLVTTTPLLAPTPRPLRAVATMTARVAITALKKEKAKAFFFLWKNFLDVIHLNLGVDFRGGLCYH